MFSGKATGKHAFLISCLAKNISKEPFFEGK